MYLLKQRDVGTAPAARQNEAMDKPKRWKWLKWAAALLMILLCALWVVLEPSHAALIQRAQQIQIGQPLAEVRTLMADWHYIFYSPANGPDGKPIISLQFNGDRAFAANLVGKIRKVVGGRHTRISTAPPVSVRFDPTTRRVNWIQRGDEIVQPSPQQE